MELDKYSASIRLQTLICCSVDCGKRFRRKLDKDGFSGDISRRQDFLEILSNYDSKIELYFYYPK